MLNAAFRRRLVAAHSRCADPRAGARLQCFRAASSGVSAEAAGSNPEPSKAQGNEAIKKDPWHVLSPGQLAVVNTIGNLSALGAAASHDHMLVRCLAGISSTMVMFFNVFMPKPLKTHQQTAGAWGAAFALLHFANLGLLLRENTGIRLTDEEEDIYERGFNDSNVTPRQFRRLLDAGAKFKDVGPGELIAERGAPVDKVIYVVTGHCTSEFKKGVSILEYHEDVFIGELQPKRWRAAYLGCGESYEETESREEMEQEEEEYLINQALSKAKQRKEKKDLRSLLTGFTETIGELTKLQVGAAWGSTVRASDDGCRLLIWPLATFSSAVGSDEKFVAAMENMCTMGIASKISAGARDRTLESYSELLSLCVYDGKIDPEERHALDMYRGRHAIPDREHYRMLEKLGWSKQDYQNGLQEAQLQAKVLIRSTSRRSAAAAPPI